MRGTRARLQHRRVHRRIIPAHAGNSGFFATFFAVFSDHPRACGELEIMASSENYVPGSSPRMRGTLHGGSSSRSLRRIIPAHAGNSAPTISNPAPTSDHPRACGELDCRALNIRIVTGSSPRMRGTLQLTRVNDTYTRIIPAHAGNSEPVIDASAQPTDHPRACGELAQFSAELDTDRGSSPRMRGTQCPDPIFLAAVRIIPAHAGNSQTPQRRPSCCSDHPRACGELSRWCFLIM